MNVHSKVNASHAIQSALRNETTLRMHTCNTTSLVPYTNKRPLYLRVIHSALEFLIHPKEVLHSRGITTSDTSQGNAAD